VSAIFAPVGGWPPLALAVTAGHAVKAMILNGLGFVNQQFYLVPHFFRNKPTSRLIAPAIAASHLNYDTLGRALNTLYAYGVTELYRLIAATASAPARSLCMVLQMKIRQNQSLIAECWIQPHAMADDLRRETMALVRVCRGWWVQAVSMPHAAGAGKVGRLI
jgi:hypothetical protein